MKSVGEVMAIGRSFAESLQKALRGLETGLVGLDRVRELEHADPAAIESALARPTPDRLLVAAEALRQGFTVERINADRGLRPVVPRAACRRSSEPRSRSATRGCRRTPPGCGG